MGRPVKAAPLAGKPEGVGGDVPFPDDIGGDGGGAENPFGAVAGALAGLFLVELIADAGEGAAAFRCGGNAVIGPGFAGWWF